MQLAYAKARCQLNNTNWILQHNQDFNWRYARSPAMAARRNEILLHDRAAWWTRFNKSGTCTLFFPGGTRHVQTTSASTTRDLATGLHPDPAQFRMRLLYTGSVRLSLHPDPV